MRVAGLTVILSVLACSPFDAADTPAPPPGTGADAGLPLTDAGTTVVPAADGGDVPPTCNPFCLSFDEPPERDDVTLTKENGGNVVLVTDEERGSVLESTLTEESGGGACVEIDLTTVTNRISLAANVRVMTRGEGAFDLLTVDTNSTESEVTLEVLPTGALSVDVEENGVTVQDSIALGHTLATEWRRVRLTLATNAAGGVDIDAVLVGTNPLKLNANGVVLRADSKIQLGECSAGGQTKSWVVRFDDLDLDVR